jgi:hemerythrin-like domain-containing protein
MLTRRREFLIAGAVMGMAGVAGGAETPKPEEDVSAVEDLMREHGVLRRILLIYEEWLRRYRANADNLPSLGLARVAQILKEFVEDYHEALEEKFIFPEFENRKQLVPLVTTLRQQHAAGRKLTSQIILGAMQEGPVSSEGQRAIKSIAPACEAFIRMYRPHAAREDTVLFPALKGILSPKQLDELGDKFEEEENRRFGDHGFEKTVERIAETEKALGIYDLDQFTPKKTP